MHASDELMALFDKDHDMRYQWFFNENGHRRFAQLVSPPVQAYRYNLFSDGRVAWSGPTIQEVMLNLAEALVRIPNADIPRAMDLVNELRRNRLAPNAPGLVLTAANRQEALRLILEERRREKPFGHRWWDIRRFSVNETPEDDVEIVRYWHPVSAGVIDETRVIRYTLPVGSRRYALPILGVDIDASDGRLRQNTY